MRRKITFIIFSALTIFILLIGTLFGIKPTILTRADEIPTIESMNSYDDLNGIRLYYLGGITRDYEITIKAKSEYYNTTDSGVNTDIYYKNETSESTNYIRSNGYFFRIDSGAYYYSVKDPSGPSFTNGKPLTTISGFRFVGLRDDIFETPFIDFKNFLLQYFATSNPTQYITLQSSPIESQIKNITYTFGNSITTLNYNNKYNLSNWINSVQNSLFISINYITKPSEIINLLNISSNNAFNIESINYGDTRCLIEIKKNGSSFTLDSRINYINILEINKTINYLSGKSFFLNPTLDFNFEMINSIKITPKENAPDGYYISYIYNSNESINEYMYFREDSSLYRYVANIGKLNTKESYFSLYDNNNGEENGQLLTSGKFIYHFNDSEYLDNYGIVPRIITFLPGFNTINFNEEILYNGDYSGTYDYTYSFVDFILDNSVEFSTEQYDTYNSGYSVGYQEGKEYATQAMGWISATFKQVDKILNVEILPHFKLWYFISVPLLFTMVIFVLKLLR